MSIIKAYSTENSKANDAETITQTTLDVGGGDFKHLLDVAVKEITAISGTLTPSGLSTEGKNTRVTLGTGGWTLLPTTALTDRNAISVQNDTPGAPNTDDIVIDFVNTGVVTDGILVKATGSFNTDITDAIVLFGRAVSGTPTVTVTEVA